MLFVSLLIFFVIHILNCTYSFGQGVFIILEIQNDAPE